MKTGMLWFDNDPQRNLIEKIHQAADYYQQKYGSQPTLCFVHPKLKDIVFEIGINMEVKFNLAISPDHIWIGTRTY
ncbi:MAG: hypothetical protein CVU46_01820 [Chloroflexi bacterium HGW-Chloroflexi-8]|jgi:hypothetical protein|nr:MAG: hypothetical protein CVU46_01820 [Chloroflexi bacterium HGW-Chloroflexi-8]